jgi:CRISPR system Cascade subunit CasC
MKYLELHILQSFPVACLNRDDLNSPKTAIFGGVQRARVSSQSWKRPIRDMAKETLPNMAGQRTRLVVARLSHHLQEGGLSPKISSCLAEMAASQISKLDSKKDANGFLKVTTLCFLSDLEFKSIAAAILDDKNETLKKAVAQLGECMAKLDVAENAKANDDKIKELKDGLEKSKQACDKSIAKDTSKAIKSVQLKDAADIALFGRMVANDHSLTLEGAAMFSHALSTHKVDNEIDFFAAVDDLQPKEEAGAGMTGTLEFNSATYYRFAALNLDMLYNPNEKDENKKGHLKVLSREERKEIVRAFIEATLQAVPGARKNSMNAATMPGYVLGVVRNSGHPVQLVNAFEKPVRAYGGKGLFETSLDAMKSEREKLNATWGLDKKELFSGVIPDMNLADFLDKVCAHVE